MKKNVFLKAGILLLSLLLLPGLSGCGAISSLMATPTPTATSTPAMTPTPTATSTPAMTPTPIPTSTPTPPKGVMYLQAPESLLRLWSQWNGRYVIYAHKSAGVDTLDDLNGMVLLIAFIEVGPNDILQDAQQFTKASGISMSFAIQNNPKVYSDDLLKDSHRVGFMVSKVAAHYGFDKNQDLVSIEFRK